MIFTETQKEVEINNIDYSTSTKVAIKYRSDKTHIEILVPKAYVDNYNVTSRDKKQYIDRMKKNLEYLSAHNELDELDKKEVLDAMSETFWEAKALNKRKK